jgi:calcium-dependent protein kinase
VRFCRDRISKENRAVKLLHKSMLTTEEINQILHEVKILSELDHPNIVHLYEFYEEPKNYCLVQELCTGGELFDMVVKKGRFQEG